MGWMLAMTNAPLGTKTELLRKLGVHRDAAIDLAEWIDKTGGLLLASGADPAVCALVASVNDGLWFQLPGHSKYLISVSGGRQGCKLGALVFNLIYSVALKRIRE